MSKINISNFPEANFLVSDGYIDALSRNGKIICEDKPEYKIVGVVRNARRGRYLEVAGNPLLDWADKTRARMVVERLKEIARDESCVFVRVRPQVIDSEESRRVFKTIGFVNSPMHLLAENTLILDLEQTEHEIFSGMRKSTRYEIKQSEKLGIKTIQLEVNEVNFNRFYNLLNTTSKRQHYILTSRVELQNEILCMAKAGMVKFYEALTSKGETIAMSVIISFNKEADYLYGSSTELARELPGAYAIQWQAICDAKQSGCKRYNFWGVAPEGALSTHRFAGVTTFKRGFGGVPTSYLPAQDLVINKQKYLITKLIEVARKKKRKL